MRYKESSDDSNVRMDQCVGQMNKKLEQRMSVAKIGMLRRIYGVIREDTIR